jgi:hypothetical protein
LGCGLLAIPVSLQQSAQDSIALVISPHLGIADFAAEILWKIRVGDPFSRSSYKNTFEKVFQFAHISGPLVAAERGKGFISQPLHMCSKTLIQLANVVAA